MARSHLTLAALATSAVAGLDVSATRPFSNSSHGDFDSALLSGSDGRRLIIRVPTSEQAEQEQSADLVALRALTAGTRSRLPFDVPAYVGQAAFDGTRGVVYDFLPGRSITLDDVRPGGGLADSIGRAIGAIHGLPTSFVAEAGLPVLSARECSVEAVGVIERAADTGHVPAALVERWEEAAADASLWQFDPTVVHGSMTVDSFLAGGGSTTMSESGVVSGEPTAVTGVLGWAALRVGDPARDLHWLLGTTGEAADTALAAYGRMRAGAADRALRQRALLYTELEVARWLLHGIASDDRAIVDDAIGMLDGLVESVHAELSQPLTDETAPILRIDEVEALLERTPGGRSTDVHARGLEPVATDTGGWDQSETGEAQRAAAFATGVVRLDGDEADADDVDAQPATGSAPSDAAAATDADADARAEPGPGVAADSRPSTSSRSE